MNRQQKKSTKLIKKYRFVKHFISAALSSLVKRRLLSRTAAGKRAYLRQGANGDGMESDKIRRGRQARFPPLSRVQSTFLPESSWEERGLLSRTAAGNRAPSHPHIRVVTQRFSPSVICNFHIVFAEDHEDYYEQPLSLLSPSWVTQKKLTARTRIAEPVLLFRTFSSLIVNNM